MKSLFIHKKFANRLVVFFSGFALEESFAKALKLPDDCDLMFLYDYSDLDFDFDSVLKKYNNISVFAYSLGLAMANNFPNLLSKVKTCVAINGSAEAIDDERAIAENIYDKTIELFDERGKENFYKRICGGNISLKENLKYFTNTPALDLKNQLIKIKEHIKKIPIEKSYWSAFYASSLDKIFPIENLKNSWGENLKISKTQHFDIDYINNIISKTLNNKIEQVFLKNLKTYKTQAVVQKQMCDKLLALSEGLDLTHIESVLELGCGTGFLTNAFADKFANAKWVLNDLSLDLCKYASMYCKADFEINSGDIANMEFDEKFDVLLSSACFQWLDDFDGFIKKISKCVNKYMIFSTFGKQNYSQIRELTSNGLNYLDKQDIEKVLSENDFEIIHASQQILDLEFESAIDVLKHIKATGVNAKFGAFWTPQKIKDFSAEYRKLCEGKILLTYNPIYIIARAKKDI